MKVEKKYQLVRTTIDDIKKCEMVFESLRGNTLDVFKNKEWEVIYVESAPFIDSDFFPILNEFILETTQIQVNFFEYPLDVKFDHVVFNKDLGLFSEFKEVMDENSLTYTGGVAFSDSMEWGIHSDPDNCVLFFGFELRHSILVSRITQGFKFLLSENDVKSKYNR